MEEEKRKAYSEVVEILKLIEDEKRLEKIPFEVIQLIKGNSDPTYKPEIRKDIPLEEQSFRNETYSILGWIANKYWGEDIGINLDSTKENIEDSKDTIESTITENKENISYNNVQNKENISYNNIQNKESITHNNIQNIENMEYNNVQCVQNFECNNNHNNNNDKVKEEKNKNIIRNAAVYNDIDPESLEGTNLPVLASNIKWYQKIKTKVISLLKFLFRIKNSEEEIEKNDADAV